MNKKPFTYIHIPKTGGTSVRDALDIGASIHYTALLKKRLLGDGVWNDSFKFCFVRNPWDRMVSWFHFNRDDLRYDGQNKKDLSNIDKDTTFTEWIEGGLMHDWKADWLVCPQQINNPLKQFVFFMDENNNSLMDFIGRFEHFERDFQYILDQIGYNVKLEKLNITSGRNNKDHRQWYTSNTKDIVGKLFEEEIDYFEYRYEDYVR